MHTFSTNASHSIDDSEALTPDQFVIRGRINNLNVISNQAVDITLKWKWKTVPALTSLFWVKWIRKYLLTLTERQKWTTEWRNIRIGDLVIICDNNTKRAISPLVRVIETFPRDSCVVLAVRVKTKNGTYVLAVSGLVLLGDY